MMTTCMTQYSSQFQDSSMRSTVYVGRSPRGIRNLGKVSESATNWFTPGRYGRGAGSRPASWPPYPGNRHVEWFDRLFTQPAGIRREVGRD